MVIIKPIKKFQFFILSLHSAYNGLKNGKNDNFLKSILKYKSRYRIKITPADHYELSLLRVYYYFLQVTYVLRHNTDKEDLQIDALYE